MSMTSFDLRRWAHSTVLFATLGAVAYAAAGASQAGYVPERFTAQAVNRGETTATPSRVELRVDRWSTDGEKTRLARTLREGGDDAFVSALETLEPLGQIRAPMTFPVEVRYAWQDPLPDGGRRVILIADRAVMVWREAMHLRGTERFTVIELRLPPDGEGEGKIAIGSRVGVNRSRDVVELTDYDAEPLRLIDVRATPARVTT